MKKLYKCYNYEGVRLINYKSMAQYVIYYFLNYLPNIHDYFFNIFDQTLLVVSFYVICKEKK